MDSHIMPGDVQVRFGDAFRDVSLKHKAQLMLIAARHTLPIGNPRAVLEKLHEFSASEAMLVFKIFDEDLSESTRRAIVEHELFETFMGRLLDVCAEREGLHKTAVLAKLILGVPACGITLPESVRMYLPNTVEREHISAFEGFALFIVTPRSGVRVPVETDGLSPAEHARLQVLAYRAPVETPDAEFDWRAMVE